MNAKYHKIYDDNKDAINARRRARMQAQRVLREAVDVDPPPDEAVDTLKGKCAPSRGAQVCTRIRPHIQSQRAHGEASNAYPPLVQDVQSQEVQCAPSRGARMYTRLALVPKTLWTLPLVPNCSFYHALRFYRETPSFCCSTGQVSLSSCRSPQLLKDLINGTSEISNTYMRHIHTYNNTFAFTSIGVKYDKNLCRNDKNVYTFRVQGMVHHFIDSLQPTNDRSANLQLYFYETENELPNSLNASNKFRPDIVVLIMKILSSNPYAQFFRFLRDVPCLDECKVVLRCNPSLDQRRYNLPTVQQVVAIWKDCEPNSESNTRHIQVYTHFGTPQRVNYYYGCYDPLPFGEPGWQTGIPRGARIVPTTTNRRLDIHTNADSSSHTFEPMLGHEKNEHALSKTYGSYVSAREYYCYRLQVRAADDSILLRGGRLFQ